MQRVEQGMGEEIMSFQLNDLVTIQRGGIDGFAQVNLSGIVGRVCSTHANALPGMVSVWVDWSKTRYADIEGLPNVINNFPADLKPVASKEVGLRIV